jgi:XisI protein
MDKMTSYKKAVKDMCDVLATRIPMNMPTIKKHLVINADNSEFILVSIGQHKNEFHYNVVLHIEVKNNKVLIYDEAIDPGVHERLTERGVPEKDILPVYLLGMD